MIPHVQHFVHEATNTFSYVVREPDGPAAAIIDSVLDYDPAAGRSSTHFSDQLVQYVRDNDLKVEWILETHVHADHLSAAAYLKESLGGRVAASENVRDVQATFREIFNLHDFNADGSQFDHLFTDSEQFSIGSLKGSVISTPGHTSDSVSFLIGNAVFVGDTLFAPDKGTARTDFPGGSALALYESTQRLLALPGDTRVFLCHDYPGTARKFEPVHSVRDQRAHNIHVGAGSVADEFVRIRESRDATLGMPALILPAVQVNIRAGQLPGAEENGVSYLKIPLNLLGRAS
ncbi:MAG TPA: MBL fold metallo-hydrolase [Woeseiaceae bacterium]|nr:MBL fold metallo-hydrolase [Woeseiaceae bacterium]